MKKRVYTALILFIVFSIRKTSNDTSTEIYQVNDGTVFGTFYHISYKSDSDFHNDIKSELKRFDNSLSPFNKKSIITSVNNNDTAIILDEWFEKVFILSKEVTSKTGGAFDITVAPLVNIWGFGFEKSDNVNDHMIDSIKQFVGSEKVNLVNGKIIKTDSRIKLDASAIAKGYASDVIAQFLKSKGIEDYLVEIGGEVALNGKSSKGECWRVGINKPIDDNMANQGEIQEILTMCEGALATSGNYRNFYYKDGKKYAHTIDPRTGYPVAHSLLSASVIAPECIIADAYATAFMVLGLEKSMEIVENTPELEAYFISVGEDDNYVISKSSGFNQYIKSKK